MNPTILPVVEGRAEVESVPILLRRLIAELGAHHVQVTKPFRVSRTAVVREGELERSIRQGIRSRPNVGAVLVLLDADDDCPASLGPALLKRAVQVTQLPVAVVLAKREFEGWFLGAKESLRGKRRIRKNANAPENPENIRGAKEHLTGNMTGRGRYVEVDDQPALAQIMDLSLAKRRCPSFGKFCSDISRLLSEMQIDSLKSNP